MKPQTLRTEGRAVEALLVLLKHLTAHARWVFVILLVFYAFSGVRTVGPREQALVMRFGRLQPQVHGPGLLIGLPDPFDRILRFETEKDLSVTLDEWSLSGSKIEDPDAPLPLTDAQLNQQIQNPGDDAVMEMGIRKTPGTTLDPLKDGYTLTSDFNIIQGRFRLRYRIIAPFLYASAGDDIQSLLARLSYRAITAQLGQRRIDASLTDERKQVADAAAEEVRQAAGRLKLGIQISGLDVIELSPASQVLAAFEDVANARQFAKTIYENSRQYDSETMAKSQGEANSILHRAQGFAANVTGEASGESAAFLSMLTEYRRDPVLISRRILRESLDTAFSNVQSRTLLPAGQAAPSIMIEPSPEFSR